MNLYLLKAHDYAGRPWDSFRGFVVAARSSGEARRRVGAHVNPPRPEGWLGAEEEVEERKFWADFHQASCELLGLANGIGPTRTPGIVLADFKHG